MSDTPNFDKVKAIDFDRLNILVAQRIAALKITAINVDKIGEKDTVEMVCRDLILPAVFLLAEFLQSVEMSEAI